MLFVLLVVVVIICDVVGALCWRLCLLCYSRVLDLFVVFVILVYGLRVVLRLGGVVVLWWLSWLGLGLLGLVGVLLVLSYCVFACLLF